MTNLSITGGKGLHLKFDNGILLSVQIGPGNYSQNYNESFFNDDDYDLPASNTAEIAVWTKSAHDMVRFPDGDKVQGYVPVDDVLKLAEFLRGLPAGIDDASISDSISDFKASND